MFFWYKNSFLATAVSFLSAALIITGVLTAIEGDPEALIVVVIGVPGMFLARSISERKAFRTWYKQRDPSVDAMVRSDAQFAYKLYFAMPKRAMLNYIRSLNPQAAANLEKAKNK